MDKGADISHRIRRSGSTWLKGVLLVLTLIMATGSLSAQNFTRRGFAFGADRDTLLYVIASPFDNWYILAGCGIQTFMGNELEASARHNKLNYSFKAEVGKWIIPDLSVSLRVSYFDVDGQTKYGLNPFVDYTQDTPNENGYYPFHANAVSFIGYVTLDWTNFFCGYEIGRRTHIHVYTPLGLGFSMLHGAQRNPRGEVGAFRKNWELSYSGGLGVEYELSQKLAFNVNFEIFGSESTWDWSPYDNSYSRYDLMPTVTFGARLNLLHKVNKLDPYTREVNRVKVNHEFLAYGTRNTVTELTGRIETLNQQIDSAENQSKTDSVQIAELKVERDSLQDALDNIPEDVPSNIMQALQRDIFELGLPSTIVYFELDKYNLSSNDRRRLRQFAKKMERLADTMEFYVIGAADSATGSIRHNQWLSEKRCMAAYNALVNDYGADRNQLIITPVGGITAYEPEEDNRMVIVILRTKEVDATIKEWTQYHK